MAGSLVKINEEIVSSAVASVTLTGIDSTYDVYVAQIINVVPSSDGEALRLRFTVGGSADISSNYHSAYKNLRGDSAFSNINNQTVDYIDLGTTGTGTQEMVNCTQYLYEFNNASSFSFASIEASIINNDSHLRGFQGGGQLGVSQATDGVYYFFNSGNITSGIFKLYGIKQS
jgi:hypothetical protein